jgi:hypothetical protein
VTVLAPTGHYNDAMRRLAILSLGLLAAACGSSPGASTTRGSAPKNPAEAAYRYASCIRAHGVPSFPDPHVTTTSGAGGSVAQAVPASAGLSPNFRSAQKACRGILPAAVNGPERHGPSKQVFLAFAQCLRAHGVSNFPDPNAQGQLTLEMISAAGVDVKGPAFFDAAKACVGVTHGQIPLAAVEQAIAHLNHQQAP